MKKKSDRFENHLRDSDEDPLDAYIDKVVHSPSQSYNNQHSGNQFGKIVLAVAILIGGYYMVSGIGSWIFSASPIDAITSTVSEAQPSQDLLNRMGAKMEEMGYAGLTDDDLRSLRSDGVTATYVSNVRSLGFTDLTLEDARRLASSDASSSFMAMMMELGYDLSVDGFVQLRDARVTAYYTSNVHDLGYRDVTPDQLIRMQKIGVSIDLIEQLQQERGEDVSLKEIIRYRISNQ
ncbi:MAG: hypothetical protein R6V27_05475 [Balneolaceae bacterium]